VASSVTGKPVGDPTRVRLARLALAATRKLPAVVGADDGPSGLYVTADPPHGVLRGVSVIAQADGRYEVDLCLNALPALGIGCFLRRRATGAAGGARRLRERPPPVTAAQFASLATKAGGPAWETSDVRLRPRRPRGARERVSLALRSYKVGYPLGRFTPPRWVGGPTRRNDLDAATRDALGCSSRMHQHPDLCATPRGSVSTRLPNMPVAPEIKITSGRQG